MGQHEHAKQSQRDKTRARTGKGGKLPWDAYRFVRIELTAQEKEDFRSLRAGGEFDGASVDDLLTQGDKLSISVGDGGVTFTASLTCAHADNPNRGLILTARGGDANTALAVLTYKLLYLVGESLWREAEDRRGGSYNDIG